MSSTPTVTLRGIHKRFGGVRALDDVSLTLRPGQVHAVLGENGAGKSTLIKILTGVYQPDHGAIVVDGSVTRLHSPRSARAAGITTVPQDVVFVPHLVVGRNILLGLEGMASRRTRLSSSERRIVQEALERVGADFTADAPTSSLSVPQLRLAQLARALIGTGQVVVLDEPTAVLSSADADHLLTRLETLRDEGKAIVYVTHRLDEVKRLADQVSVLRDGRLVGEMGRADYDRAAVIELMTKRSESSLHPASRQSGQRARESRVLLRVDRLSAEGRLTDVSFAASTGQIIGIAGVQGSGQGNLLAALAGQARYDSGSVHVDGRAVLAGSLRSAYRAGIHLVPADRLGSGIVGGMSIQENLALPMRAASTAARAGLRRRAQERRVAGRYIADFAVRCRDAGQTVGTLSGGNQQKISLSRALVSSPTVLLIDEPTQGVDVGAKADIRELLRESLEHADRCVVIATSEFEDLVGLADHIVVMRAGRVVGEIPGADATYQKILDLALP